MESFGQLFDSLVGVKRQICKLLSEFGVFLFKFRILFHILVLLFLKFEYPFFELVYLVFVFLLGFSTHFFLNFAQGAVLVPLFQKIRQLFAKYVNLIVEHLYHFINVETHRSELLSDVDFELFTLLQRDFTFGSVNIGTQGIEFLGDSVQ